MPASIKNILIGVFVILAIVVVVFMLLFLHPSVGDNAKTLRVRFTDIDKVNLGTRVTFAGRPVGEVVSIREVPDARISRVDRRGDVYVYELEINVDSGVDVFNTDDIILRTSGLLGERNIEINPRPLKPGETLQRVEDEILYASQTTSVEDTMKQIGDLSKQFEIVLSDFHEAMQELKEQKVIAKIGASAQNLVDITGSLNQPDKWRNILDNTLTLTERVNHSWTTVDSTLQNIYSLTDRAHRSWNTIDDVLGNFQATATNAKSFSEKVNELINYTRQGKGTLGQLVVGDDLYLRLKSILHKGEVTMNDINTYGVLFHLDKRWQRLQSRRLRLLEKLSTPNEFARFFNTEMDQMSTSLSRVTTLLNESDCYPDSLMYNPDFTKRFSDLLRRVENMEESLKMYNEQVIDQESAQYTQY